MGKKSKLKKNKTPLVSILTPTFRRSKLLYLLAECIVNQEYPLKKIEWIIVDGENEKEYYNSVPDVINEIKSRYKNLKIIYDLYPMNDKNMIGGLRNRTNELANGEIMVCMDDDDYYCPKRVIDAVKALNYGKLSLAGCSKMYMYDFDTDTFIEFGPFNNNHGVNNTFAYHTFFCEIEEEFPPLLNDEHCGYAWVGNNRYPKPLHPGLFSTINIDTVVEKLKALQSL